MSENGQTINDDQPNGESADLQRSLTEIARCLNELTNQLHGAAPGDAPTAFEETRPLVKALQAQLGSDGTDAWARALAETASEDDMDDSSQGFEALPYAGAAPNCGRTEDFGHRLRSRAEEPCASVADLKRAMHRAIAAAQSDWQARLDADLATATEVWSERISSSIESSAQRAADLVTLSSEQTASQFEQAMGERVAAMNKSFAAAGAEAEKQLAAVRASFEGEMMRAQGILARVNSTAATVDDQAARLAAITEIAQQELKRRGSAILEWHSDQLVQHAKKSMGEWSGRLQAALETAGQGTVARLGVEFEQQLNSRMDRARGILDRLENESATVEKLLRAQQAGMERLSEQAVENVLGRLEKVGTDWESRIEEKGRAATNKWIADMSCQAAESPRNGRQSVPVVDRTAEIRFMEKESKASPNDTQTILSSGQERRGIRRLRISRPLLVRPEDPAYKEAVETTRNASRGGVYFTTAAKYYYPGMHLRVTLGYSPNDPCNAASFGKVLRLDPLENGDWGVAVRIMLR